MVPDQGMSSIDSPHALNPSGEFPCPEWVLSEDPRPDSLGWSTPSDGCYRIACAHDMSGIFTLPG